MLARPLNAVRGSLRARLILALVSVTVLFVGALTWIAVSSATDDQKAAVYREMTNLARERAAAIDTRAAHDAAVAHTVASVFSQDTIQTRADALSVLHSATKADPRVASVYTIFAPNGFDGRDAAHIRGPGTMKDGQFGPYWNRLKGTLELEPPTPDYAVTLEKPYFGVPMKTGRDYVAEPYDYSGTLMTTYSSPIVRGGRRVGVGAVDVSLAQLAREIEAAKVLDSGYAFAVSRTGTLLAWPDRKQVGKMSLARLARTSGVEALAQVAAGLRAGRSGSVEARDPRTGEDATLFYAPVANGGWGVVLVAPRSEVLASVAHLRTKLLLVGLACILLMGGIVAVLASRVTKPIRALVSRLGGVAHHDLPSLRDGLTAMAAGDLTRPAEATTAPLPVRGRDEIAAATEALNELVASTGASIEAYDTTRAGLGGMLGRVSANATTVASVSAQMSGASGEAGRAMTEIASAVTDVARGAERQVAMVADAQTSAEGTVRAADEARTVAQEGAGAAAAAAQAMGAVRTSSVEVDDAIRDLAGKSDQIGGIVSTITGIAEQTNLLALNAAIEAARAGESGRGFAVVAEEVRGLAEEAHAATQSIAGLIGDIQTQTRRAVELVHTSAQRSDEGAQVLERSREAFEQILARVADVGTRVESIAQATTEVAAVAEQSSASTEQVSASTQETTASAQEIAASAAQLATTAGELEELVSRFTLEGAAR